MVNPDARVALLVTAMLALLVRPERMMDLGLVVEDRRVDARQQVAGLALQHAMRQVVQVVGQRCGQVARLQSKRTAAYDDERSEFRFAELNGVRLIRAATCSDVMDLMKCIDQEDEQSFE